MNDRIFFSSKSDVFLFYNAGMAYFSNNLTELISAAAISCKLFEGKKIYTFFFFIKWLSITCSRRNSQIVFRFIQNIFLSVGVRTFWFNVSLHQPTPTQVPKPRKNGALPSLTRKLGFVTAWYGNISYSSKIYVLKVTPLIYVLPPICSLQISI